MFMATPITLTAEQVQTLATIMPEAVNLSYRAYMKFTGLFCDTNSMKLSSCEEISEMDLNVGLLPNGAPIMKYRMHKSLATIAIRYIFVTPKALLYTLNPSKILPAVYHPEKVYENCISCFHDFDEKSVTYFNHRLNAIFSEQQKTDHGRVQLREGERELFIALTIAFLKWHEDGKSVEKASPFVASF
jgi:hypothetical protein